MSSQSTVDLDHISPEDAARHVQSLKDALPDASKCLHNDETLLRFMIARSFKVDDAKQMILAFEEWRTSISLDALPMPPTHSPMSVAVRGYRCVADANPQLSLSDDTRPALPEAHERINKYWAGGSYHAFDKEFNALYIERLGYHDAKGLAKNVTSEEMNEWHTRNMEFYQRVLSKECTSRALETKQTGEENGAGDASENGKAVSPSVLDARTKMTIIFDAQGMGFHQFHMPALKLLRGVTDLDQKYYPETLNKLFIVNAPYVFVKIWSIIKQWLDPRVIGKVQILGGIKEFKPLLLEQIPEKNLPDFLGGSCTCSHIPGGCVPSQVLDNIKPVSASAE